MAFKPEYLTPDLELPYKGKTYRVPPPTDEDGRKLATIIAIGMGAWNASREDCPTCGRSGAPELSEDTQAVIESMQDDNASDLALTRAVHQQMIDDGVPGPHIKDFTHYATYYWVFNEATADAMMAAQKNPGGGASGEAFGVTPKGTVQSSTPRRGPRTASANPTSTASTPDTGEHPHT